MSAKQDMQRLLGDILRPGLITSIDHAAQRCTVEIGDMTTRPLPWIAFGGSGSINYDMASSALTIEAAAASRLTAT